MSEQLVDDLLLWYADHARALPWRRADVDPWAVLVCEVMSQQTPVARVVPAWQAWLDRWPDAASLAGAAPGEAVRMWGRLGYPRRALRLHQAAVVVRDRWAGVLPEHYEDLLTLPGVGPYTAGATAAFAHGRRAVVLDVNVRRVLARLDEGTDAPPGAPTRAETERAQRLLPADAARSVRWNAAAMELGATVCTARAPRCEVCPVRAGCRWRSRDRSTAAPAPRTTRPQVWAGTDRYVRGLLLAVLREEPGAVPGPRLTAVWPEPAQTARCLAGLLADGLVEAVDDGYRLPT